MPPLTHKHKAFSLIELLVVIVLIGLFVLLVLPSFARYQQRTRLIQAHVSFKSAIEEALSASRAEPQTFMISLKIGESTFRTFSCGFDVETEIIDPGCETDTIAFDPGTVFQEIKRAENWDEAISFTQNSMPINRWLLMIFQPPYGEVSFKEVSVQPGAGGSVAGAPINLADFYYIEIENPSPLHSYFNIWKSGLIEDAIAD